MDTKITLSFSQKVIEAAKEYAYQNGLSLSRLTEILLHKVTTGGYKSLEDFPISDWVNLVAAEQAEFKTKAKTRKALKAEFFEKNK